MCRWSKRYVTRIYDHGITHDDVLVENGMSQPTLLCLYAQQHQRHSST